MKKVINCCFLLALLFQCSCKRHLNAPDYIKYVRNSEHGLVKTITIGGWQYTIQYKPADYIIYQESKGLYTDSTLKKRMQNLKGTVWFDIKVGREDGQITPLKYGVATIEEYNERLDYFLNHAQSDIQLAYGKDTLRPISYLFENNYNLTPQETMIVGFELPANETTVHGPIQLSYTDRIFKNGIIKAMYKVKDLENIPNLIY